MKNRNKLYFSIEIVVKIFLNSNLVIKGFKFKKKYNLKLPNKA